MHVVYGLPDALAGAIQAIVVLCVLAADALCIGDRAMDWSMILNWTFVVALATAAIRLAVPILLATLGEIITDAAAY